MASLLYQTIEQISREKHIEPEVIVAAIEDAMIVAARKYYKTEEDLRAKFNPDSGQVEVFAVRPVVEEVTDPKKEFTLAEAKRIDPNAEIGGEVIIPKPTDVLGRIAAQTAKQVIMQKVREAERDTVFNEYNGRVGELVNCVVKRTEGPDVVVDLGRAEARMPKREQSRLETYNIGDRLRVVIRAVDRSAKGPQVIVSRADPILVQRLFEMEVPEIYDGTVTIRAIAREAGERTKIAVMSRDKDVDPVGACVGMKGMRVQSIIRELRGEKIDIIEFSEEITTFAEKALQPAKVSRVSITDLGEKQLEIIVDDTQLSLAIGKKGQNVRLAAKLLAWKIDIKSEEEKRQEVEQQMQGMGGGPTTAIEQVSELGESIIQKLVTAGITTVEALADMTPEQLEEIPGIGEKTLEKISVAVRHYFGEYEPGEERVVSAEEQARLSSEASIDEEIDALTQDLTQEGEESVSREGSGHIVDELAEERLAEVTEVGPDLDTEGGESLVPGRDDVSETIVEEQPHTLIHGELVAEDAILEGNTEEIKDEGRPEVDDETKLKSGSEEGGA